MPDKYFCLQHLFSFLCYSIRCFYKQHFKIYCKMYEPNNRLVSIQVPAVQFESDKEFQTKGLLYDGDSDFLSNRNKWIQTRSDSQTYREILTTLLPALGDNISHYVEKFIDENISYRDLASLNCKDLELMGFTRSEQKDELLSLFAQFPNQDPSLEHIYNLKESSNYNHQMINNAANHLESMRSALAAANYKLQIMPPEDVIVGEKSFASRFVLEALNELYGVTDDIEKDIFDMEQIIYTKQHSTPNSPPKKAANYLHVTAWLIVGSLSSIGIMALYLWKYKK